MHHLMTKMTNNKHCLNMFKYSYLFKVDSNHIPCWHYIHDLYIVELSLSKQTKIYTWVIIKKLESNGTIFSHVGHFISFTMRNLDELISNGL